MIEKLNTTSKLVVDSYDKFEEEAQFVIKEDDPYKKLKKKVDYIVQSCASQHQPSCEVFTEADSKTKTKTLWSFNYKLTERYKC